MGVGRALDVDHGAWGQPRLLGVPRLEVGRSKQKRAGGRCLRARARRAWVPCGPGEALRACVADRGRWLVGSSAKGGENAGLASG